MVATEYERVAAVDKSRRLEMLKKDRSQLRKSGPAMSQSASGLAHDYTQLTTEILDLFTSMAVTIVDTDDMPMADFPEFAGIEDEDIITRTSV